MAEEAGTVNGISTLRAASFGWEPEEAMALGAARVLPAMLEVLVTHGAAAIRPGSDPHGLHQFRLDVKRMRYTAELFGSVYGAELGELVLTLKELQGLLGEMNDCDATILHLEKLREEVPAEFRKYLKGRFAGVFKELRLAWRSGLGRKAAQRRWLAFLAAPGADSVVF
jgi:inorganic triphosphatase YgiF